MHSIFKEVSKTKTTRKNQYRPLSPERIDRILRCNAATPPMPAAIPVPPPKEDAAPVFIFSGPQEHCISRSYDYDSLHPEETLRRFVSFLHSVRSRYDANYAVVGEMDLSQQDLLHAIEMSDDMDAKGGYDMYRRTREVRRNRRCCKNENELLEPIRNFLENNAGFITSLERLQGDVAAAKQRIDGKRYTYRTKIMEGNEK